MTAQPWRKTKDTNAFRGNPLLIRIAGVVSVATATVLIAQTDASIRLTITLPEVEVVVEINPVLPSQPLLFQADGDTLVAGSFGSRKVWR